MKNKQYVITAAMIIPVTANYEEFNVTYEQHFFLCRDMDALVRDSIFWHYIYYYCPFKTERISDEEFKKITESDSYNNKECVGIYGNSYIKKVLSDNFKSVNDIRKFGEKIFVKKYVDELMNSQSDTNFPYFDFNGGLYYDFSRIPIPTSGYDAFKKDIHITSLSDNVCEFDLTLYSYNYLGESYSEECTVCRAVKINGEWKLECPLLWSYMN